MTPRTASLRVAHQGNCPNATKTALTSVGRGSGCKCEPSFYTFQRNRDGKPEKGSRIKSRQVADRALRKLQVEIDEGRVGQSRPKELTFNEWADKYEAIIEGKIRAGHLKPKTLRAYRETLALARLEFGGTWLREIGPSELRGFLGRIEKQREASQLRHLRQLSACLTVAVDEGKGHLETNPVPAFIKKQRLKAPKRGKAPFEDGELERMWKAYKAYEPVYGHASRFSAESGLRLGELVALDWPNVDLTNGRVYVEYTWDEEAGPVKPKDGEARHVYLTKEARAVVEEWVVVVGAQDQGPVFPNPIGGGRLIARQVQRRLGNAMEDASVPKMHPGLRLPRSFHSFRYTTSVLMQRRGYHPRLIESNLGHSSLELTYGVYGGWTPDQLQAEATRTPE
jgi:integrase